MNDLIRDKFFEVLIAGDRPTARTLVRELLARVSGEDVIQELFWPTYENIEKLHRQDHLTSLAYHTATRLLRTLIDQAGANLTLQARNGKRVFCACGPSESEELGAQMAVDLLESYGYEVAFAGGGVPADEIQGRVQEDKPDVLLMFCSAAADLPSIRQLIDTLHEVGACPRMQIVVGGGVFNRAPGLAEELGADLWAVNPLDLIELMTTQATARANLENRTVGKKRLTGAPSGTKTKAA